MWIPVSLEMRLTNWENQIIEEVPLFDKLLAFRKLMVRIGKILHAKVVRRIVVVGDFLVVWLVFVVFPASS